MAAQELSEFDDLEFGPTGYGEEEKCEMGAKSIDIWRDATCLELLKERMMPDTIDLEEGKRAKKQASNYCWKGQRLYFKGLYVPKPEERIPLVIQMHKDLGHFGE